MEVFFDPDTLFHKENWFKSTYYSIRAWFKYTFNKNHIALMKEAYKGRPWDDSYLLELEYKKIKEMADYLEKEDRFAGVQYVVRDMRICLSLIEIFTDKRELFHYDGCLLQVPGGDGSPGRLMRIVESPDFKYNCDVRVNLRNISRFVPKEDAQVWYGKCPHELYVLKARYLYHKIRNEREQEWWD